MDLFRERFSIFLANISPKELLTLGFDFIDNLSLLSQTELNGIGSLHIIALLNSIFDQDSLINPYFASQLLMFLVQTIPEKCCSIDIFTQSIQLLESTSNSTSCGYFYQFVRPFIMKKNSVLAECLLSAPHTVILIKHIINFSIRDLIKDLITTYPENTQEMLFFLFEHINISCLTRKASVEVLCRVVSTASSSTLKQFLPLWRLHWLINSISTFDNQLLIIAVEILRLPLENETKQQLIGIISVKIQILSQTIFKSINIEQKINILIAVRLALVSRFGLIEISVGQSEFLELATETFFCNHWNSMIHVAYCELMQVVLESNSNFLLESACRSKVADMLIKAAQNPISKHKKQSTRLGYMGQVTKIAIILRDHASRIIRSYLKTIKEWEVFMVYISSQEAVENSVLGGRTRYRHLTADDIRFIHCAENEESVRKSEEFYSGNYWSLSIPELQISDMYINN